LLQTLKVSKLSIGKALGPVLLSVFNDADADAVAAIEELGDSLDGGIVGEIA